MKASTCFLLLILTSRVCAQTEQTRPSPLTADQSHVPKPGETISLRELRIPPKAAEELQRSQSALKSGEIRSSAQHLEKALRIYPGYLEGHNNLGARYMDLGEYEKAEAEFQKAIDIDPHVMQPFNNLSVAYYFQQRYSDAEAAARRAIDLDPRSSMPRYMLGCTLAAEKRNPVEAMEMLRQTKSEFPNARLVLADILVRRGALKEAQEELRGYLALPGAEKKQSVEGWIARLTQTLTADRVAQSSAP